ncbi:MAG: hypothetical protein Q8J69_09695 [Sphingobacteriaceae bacterium]|nr:hypothetical protein [Sphingobacteriaceae bacterium]
MSPETKAKYLELIKGTNLTESMIETAYENGALEGEEKGMVNGEQRQLITTVLRAFDKGSDIAFISDITQHTVDEVRTILVENNRIVKP